MKLIFKKEEDQNISIHIAQGTAPIEFTYVDMIKDLLKANEIEESIFEGDISDEEKERLNTMLQKIKASMAEDPTE